jgi:hypothetical protein
MMTLKFMEKFMQNMLNKKTWITVAALAFFILLTRGSHVLTQFALPDASLAVFLMGGLLLRRALWFVVFFVLASVIDFGAAAFDPAQGFCLTNGYWGLIPSYGAMWLGGVWLSQQTDSFKSLPFALVTSSTSLVAFVISTQTYYLYSGRFPAKSIFESIQHGWEYLPSWMGFSAMYFAIIWLTTFVLRQFHIIKPVRISA